jgi:sugar lactone lactonase YvrE
MPSLPLRTFLVLAISCQVALAETFVVSRIAGNPAAAAGIADGSINNPVVARFDLPTGVAVNSGGTLFIVDSGSNALRSASLVGNGNVGTVAGSSTAGFQDGLAVNARFNGPEGVEVDAGNEIYLCDTKNHRIRKVLTGSLGSPVETVAGSGGRGSANGNGTSAEFDSPKALAFGALGSVFVCDTGNHAIRKIDLSTSNNAVTTVAGTAGQSGAANGTGILAKFKNPSGIAVSSAGIIYVADTGNHCIRKIIAASGLVTTLAGKTAGTAGHKDGKAADALFNSPRGLTLDGAGNLLVCDSGNYTIRRVLASTGAVSTISGTPNVRGSKNGEIGALYNGPTDICTGSEGGTEVFFIADGKGSSFGDGGATLRKLQVKIAAPTITAHPSGVTVAAGGSAIFKVSATAPSGKSLVYSWYKDDQPEPIGTTATLTIPGVRTSDEGTYFARIVPANGGPVVQSFPAPLVIKGQQTWQWISRPGSTTPDTIQGLSLRQSAVPARGLELWASGLAGGHVLRKLSPITALQSKLIKASSKGDGAPAVVIDSLGGLYAGMDEVLVLDKPGLLNRYNAAGSRLWGLRMGTKPLLSTSSPQAEVMAVALTQSDLPVVGGSFLGLAEFIGRKNSIKTTLGSATHTRLRGFISAVDADGNIRWIRQLYGNSNSTGDSVIHSIVVDPADDSIYACGHVGPGAKVTQSSTLNDEASLATTVDSAPFVLKFDSAGTLLWSHVLDDQGIYFGLTLDAVGDVWVTGHSGDRGAPAQQSAVLRQLDAADGSVLMEKELLYGKGLSVSVHPQLGVGWLVADGAGRLDVLGRAFPNVSGYRLIRLDTSTLDPIWDLPAFGRLSPDAEKADLIFTPDGRMITSLNFAEEDRSRAVVDFTGRTQYLMKGRKDDGFIAVVGELPTVDVGPVSQFVEKGTNVTFETTFIGDLTPLFQWYKSTAALKGKTASSLVLPGVTTTNAGSYAVRLSNGRDVKLSTAAKLAVIDSTPQAITAKVGKSITLTVPTGGEGLTYQWRNLIGSQTKTLTIRNSIAGTWEYICDVTCNFMTPPKTISKTFTLTVTP